MQESKISDDARHPWDHYSDQPRIITDKAYKKRMKRKNFKDLLLTLGSSIIIFPLAIVAWLCNRKVEQTSNYFFSLCVNLDKGEEQFALIKELGCNSIQVRFFLSEMERLEDYYNFISGFSVQHVLVTIIQDRQHIDDPALLARDMAKVFKTLSPKVKQFQIGTTINRSKWGFFSVAEYMRFFQTVQGVRDQEFPNLTLLGPGVIDFEYPYLIRALFNNFKVRFDKVAALLYVDRRGAPENAQMKIFDTRNKINLLHSIARLSPKSSSKLLLTEVNWPLQNTAPWAPTSEKECVSEGDYSNFLLRYHLLALASQKIESVYWHQLIAPGYGLVDSREGFRRREAFYTYKVMQELLTNTLIKNYKEQGGVYQLSGFDPSRQREVIVLWGNNTELALEPYLKQKNISLDNKELTDKLGRPLNSVNAIISDSPIYIIG